MAHNQLGIQPACPHCNVHAGIHSLTLELLAKTSTYSKFLVVGDKIYLLFVSCAETRAHDKTIDSRVVYSIYDKTLHCTRMRTQSEI